MKFINCKNRNATVNFQLLYLTVLLCCVEDDDDDDDGVENKKQKFLKLRPKDFWDDVD